MNKPVVSDNEAEASLELAASLEQLNAAAAGASAHETKTVFNITVKDVLSDVESVELQEYEARLQAEVREWSTLFRNSLQFLKLIRRQPETVVDTSLLVPMNREYIESGPDLRRFVHDSVEFRQMAYVFLEKHCIALREAQLNLMENCEHVTAVVKESKLAKNMANK